MSPSVARRWRNLLIAAMISAGVPAPLAAIGVTSARSAEPGPRQLVDRAVEAMGGRARLVAVKSLVMDGLGDNPNLLQQMRPDSPLLVWMLPQWRRSIDFEHGRTALQMVRRPAFPAVFDNWAYDGRLDGSIAYDVGAPFGGAPPPPRRASAAEVRARRLAMLHHPLAVLRAALAPGAALTNLRDQGRLALVDLRTADGDRVTIAFDRQTGLPASVASMSENVLLGDVATVTRFSGWEYAQPSGLRLPKRLTSTIDGWPEYDIGVMKNDVDAPVELAAPGALQAAVAVPVAETVTSEQAGKGVWLLSSQGGYAGVLIEFADHLALIDAPQGEARAEAFFAKARALVPGKPLTQLTVSHFHADHAGGVRTAIAEGLTLVTQRGNEAFFRDVAQRKFTLEPDLLARRPKPLKIVSFDDSLTLKDAANEVVLYHARGSTHGDTLLMAWFPRDRLLAQADLWLPGSRITPHAVAFAEDIARRGLEVDKHLPLHGGAIKSNTEFVALVQALRAGTAK